MEMKRDPRIARRKKFGIAGSTGKPAPSGSIPTCTDGPADTSAYPCCDDLSDDPFASFARTGTVSHVEMEHSSIVTFIEWNWLGGKTGQLAAHDATVHGIGSVLDPEATGTPVP